MQATHTKTQTKRKKTITIPFAVLWKLALPTQSALAKPNNKWRTNTRREMLSPGIGIALQESEVWTSLDDGLEVKRLTTHTFHALFSTFEVSSPYQLLTSSRIWTTRRTIVTILTMKSSQTVPAREVNFLYGQKSTERKSDATWAFLTYLSLFYVIGLFALRFEDTKTRSRVHNREIGVSFM